MSSNIIKSITSVFTDDDVLTPLPEIPKTFSTTTSSIATPISNSVSNTASSISSFFLGITWQTWLIVILLLALIGINVFAYLAKGTQVFGEIFNPIFKLFGYTAIETTKQTVETTATGTNAGVNTLANTTVGALNTVEQAAQNGPTATSGTSVGLSTAPIMNSMATSNTATSNTATSNTTTSNTATSNTTTSNTATSTYPQGQLAASSQKGQSIDQLREAEATKEQYQEDTLEKALSNAAQSVAQTGGEVQPYDQIKTTGQAGWCFIGEDLGVRTCSQVGVNDVCMSGDVFPSQEICMNPNLRP